MDPEPFWVTDKFMIFPGDEPQFLGHSALSLVAISTPKTGTRITAPRLRQCGKKGG
jgi:hypothetical protein